MMKKNSYLVNTSRGEILEEKGVDHRILIAGDDKDQRFIKYINKIYIIRLYYFCR